MIYGEESETFTVDNGLWYDYKLKPPRGFAKKFLNLIPGSNRMRSAFRSQSAVLGTLGPFNQRFGAGSFFPRHPGYLGQSTGALEYYDFLGESNINSPSFLSTTVGNVTTYYKAPDAVASGVSSYIGLNNMSTGSIRYLDKIYNMNFIGSYNASGLSSGGLSAMYPVSGWNFSTSAVMAGGYISTFPTVSFSYGNTPKLLMYKNRMFFIAGSRVYYTDVPGVGLYPETWNDSLNFFDLPTDTDSVIYNAFVLGDSLYMFTKKGVFTLLAVGLPANWIIRKVSDLSVGWSEAVCMANNIFYAYSNGSIYVYNGYSNPSLISAPISRYLTEYDGVGLHAFEDGIIASIQKLTYVDVANGWKCTDGQLLYFNNLGWSRYTIAGLAGNSGCSISSSSVYKRTAMDSTYSKGKASTYLSLNMWDSGSSGRYYKTLYIYTDGVYSNEAINTSVSICTDFSDPAKYKRIKSIFYGIHPKNSIVLAGAGQALSITAETYSGGLIRTSTAVSGVLDTTDEIIEIRCKAPQYARRIEFVLNVNLNSSASQLDGSSVYEFLDLTCIYNTARSVTEELNG